MRILFKILVSGLLLVLAAAIGAEVAALHRAAAPASAAPASAAPVAPVVVRKAPDEPVPPKLVRPLPRPVARHCAVGVR